MKIQGRLSRALRAVESEAGAGYRPAAPLPAGHEEVTAGLDEYRFGADGQWRVLVANTRELRETAFRLVFDQYLSRGYDLRLGRDSGMWYTIQAFHPQTLILLVEHLGRPVGALSVVPDSRLGLPADHIFPGHLARLRAAGRRPCEIASLAVTEDSGEGRIEIPLHLFKLAWLSARHMLGATDMVATAMAHHAAFYARVLLFDEVSEDSRPSPKTGELVRYVRLRLETAEARYQERYEDLPSKRNLFRFFVDGEGPRMVEWLRGCHRPMNADEIYHFGVRRSSILAEAKPGELAALVDCCSWRRQPLFAVC